MTLYAISTRELGDALRAVADRLGDTTLSGPVSLYLTFDAQAAMTPEAEDLARLAVGQLAEMLQLSDPEHVPGTDPRTWFQASDNKDDIYITAQARVTRPATELDAAKARIKELEAELAAKFTAPVEPPAALAAEFPSELTPFQPLPWWMQPGERIADLPVWSNPDRGEPCYAEVEGGVRNWKCTRDEGHAGLHRAATSRGAVVAEWEA